MKTSSAIETLDARIAPASLVTVTFTGGALELSGDSGAHSVTVVALDTSIFQLTAAPGTLFHMEGSADTDTLLFQGAIKSFTADLGADADSLTLIGLNVLGDVKIDMKDGANVLNLDSVTAKGRLEVTGGTGSDAVSFFGALTSVKRDAILSLGDGGNGLTVAANLLKIGGNLSYTGGADADTISIGSAVAVGGGASFAWGGGINQFVTQPFATIITGKVLNFDSSTSLTGGNSTINLSAIASKFGGGLRIVDGEGGITLMTTLGINSVAGNVNIITGAGPSNVTLGTQSGSGAITIDASQSSASTVQLTGFGGIGGTFNYTGGAGVDSITMQLLAGSKAPASLIADMGDGANTIQLTSFSGSFKNIQVTGGTGTDAVSVTVLNGAVKNIEIDNGDGPATTMLQIFNSKVAGQVKVVNGTDAGAADLTLNLTNTQVGAVSYSSGTNTNTVNFGQSAGMAIKNGISVTTGAGTDTVNFGALSNATIGKLLNLNLGDGTNTLTGLLGNVSFGGVVFTGGSGNDSVSLTGTGKLGAVSLSLGAGSNAATIVGGTVPFALSSLTVTSSSTTGQTDSLTLARIQLRGNLNATLGADISTLRVDDSLIGGTFTIDTGAGSDIVTIDTTDTYVGTTLAKAASLTLGDGDDSLTLGGNTTTKLLITKSKFKADGGAGMNTLVNSGTNVFAQDPVFTALP